MSDVYSLNEKVIISNEPWALVLRCTTLDKGYSMFIGCQHWGSALGLPVIGWCLEVPLRLLCESEAKLVEVVGLGGEAQPWSTLWPLVGYSSTTHNLLCSLKCNIEWSSYEMPFKTMSLKVLVPEVDFCSISSQQGQLGDSVSCQCTESLPVHAFQDHVLIDFKVNCCRRWLVGIGCLSRPMSFQTFAHRVHRRSARSTGQCSLRGGTSVVSQVD